MPSSHKMKRAYSVGKVKLFLQKTKNQKGVKVEEFFEEN